MTVGIWHLYRGKPGASALGNGCSLETGGKKKKLTKPRPLTDLDYSEWRLVLR